MIILSSSPMGDEASGLLHNNPQNDAVPEWELGLPSPDTLTPLSQSLIPPELANAFKISPQPPRSSLDVTRASHSTLSSLRAATTFNLNPNDNDHDPSEASESKRSRPIVDSSSDDIAAIEEDQSTAAVKTLNKRPRLVWTPQLHKRFVEVVAHLGLKNAVPKTIMQLMNVEGLTRENVASHLQKYRLYVKRMQGLSNEGPSPSDHLFASTPVPPQSLNESGSSFGNGGYANGGGGGGGGSGSVANSGNGNGSNHVGMHPMAIPYPLMPMMGNHGFHYPQQFGGGGVNVMHQHQQREWSGKYGNGYQNQSNQ